MTLAPCPCGRVPETLKLALLFLLSGMGQVAMLILVFFTILALKFTC